MVKHTLYQACERGEKHAVEDMLGNNRSAVHEVLGEQSTAAVETKPTPLLVVTRHGHVLVIETIAASGDNDSTGIR